MFSQIMITVSALLSVYFSQTPNLAKYACFAGLIGQPFWFVISLETGKPALLFLTVMYTIVWIMGFYNFWIKPSRENLETQND